MENPCWVPRSSACCVASPLVTDNFSDGQKDRQLPRQERHTDCAKCREIELYMYLSAPSCQCSTRVLAREREPGLLPVPLQSDVRNLPNQHIRAAPRPSAHEGTDCTITHWHFTVTPNPYRCFESTEGRTVAHFSFLSSNVDQGHSLHPLSLFIALQLYGEAPYSPRRTGADLLR